MIAPMRSKSGPRGRTGAFVAFAILVAAGPLARTRLSAQVPAPSPEAPKRNIAGPGDYALREKIVRLLSRDPELGKEPFSIILVNGGAVFSGEIRSCALKRRALSMAGSTRGIINVTDEMTVPRGDVADAELAKAVTSVLSDAAASLDLQDLDVQVVDGVLTLQGKVKDLLSRTRAEDVAGTVLGVTRISNHLVPADAPSGADDASLLRAVVAYLNDFHAFGFPSDITVRVEKGTVTLRGRVALYVARQRAALAASLVKGVARVDNRIKVDPSIPGRITRVQAER